MNKSALARREPKTITAKIVDPFFVRIEYDPRSPFRWHAVCYKTETHDLSFFDWNKGKTVPSRGTFDHQVDSNMFSTLMGAKAWARKALRRERRLANAAPVEPIIVR
jgi:hypothetical protein